ncbi:NADPH-dependent glutamate synthase [Candidatus Woesearchaeota archaeon]|nr:NADPH-dependent glutamate synthase [Candidatus Woesearchaeota archaeon]
MSTTPVRELDPKKRVENFEEVCLGYDSEEAVKEASRCLQCKNPTCIEGCPAKVDIPSFIKSMQEKKFGEALAKIKETNNLPGVCGRVCPQESQCEQSCILHKAGKAVAIGKLERFAADNGGKSAVPKIKKLKKKVAVVGSGPASLSCAADLALKGYCITIFEALHKVGGVLRYGIPEFRLPRNVLDDEIDFIKKLGVKIDTDTVIGKTIELSQLSADFDAVFLGTGAGSPNFMDIPGEDLNNVYSANEFLTRINLMRAHEFPEYRTPVKQGSRVVVVGGGNVAVDSARTAKRLGAHVTIVYRRSFDEMPARIEEIKHAQEEGVELLMLTNPIRVLGSGKVEGVECVQMRLGEEDETGRKSPIPMPDTEFTIPCDQFIVAIGTSPNPIIAKTGGIMVGGWNRIVVNENLQTSKDNIFAGGDAISGSATVIKAIGDGKKAAEKIDEFLKGKLG